MSSQESEQMLALLKELSMLKALDREYATGGKSDAEQDEHRLRQQRHEEIGQEIKDLAAQKNGNQE